MRRRSSLAVAAGATVLALAGCTSNPSPHRPTPSTTARPGPSSPATPTTPPDSTSPATTSVPPSTASTAVTSTPLTSTPVTSTPSPTRTTPGVPACAPPTVTGTRAPFCYTLPRGFTNYSSVPNYGRGWTYRTLVSIGRHDLVEVFAARGSDTDRASEAALKAMYDRAFLLRAGVLGIAEAGPAHRTSVDGARAYRQVARYRNGVTTDITTVYRGHTVVSIQCQSQKQKMAVAVACASVRTSLDLVRR